MELDDFHYSTTLTWPASDKAEKEKCLNELRTELLRNLNKWKEPAVCIVLPQATDDDGNPIDGMCEAMVFPDLESAKEIIDIMLGLESPEYEEYTNNKIVENKILGCFFGQAIGDALGLGTEFMRRGEVFYHYPEKLTEYNQIIQDEHRRRWYKGQWTDDTDMMLCIAQAVIDCDGRVDLSAIARNFKEWYNGNPLGIGNHTAKVLGYTEYEKDPIKGAEEIWTAYGKRSAANGALMRTSVVGLLKNYTPEIAEDICRLTHPHPQCVGSCVVVSTLIHELVYNRKGLSCVQLTAIADRYDA